MSTVPALVDDVNSARRRVISATEGLTLEQEAFRLGSDEWSVPQVIEHLVLAEQVGIVYMWEEVTAVRSGAPTWDGDHIHEGRSIEEIVDLTWQEREEAPPTVIPQWDGPLALSVATLEACQYILASFATALHGLDPYAVICPHFLMGPLDAVQRLEFLRWHMDHHREQIEEIKQALPA